MLEGSASKAAHLLRKCFTEGQTLCFAQERLAQVGIQLTPDIETVESNPAGVEFGSDNGSFENPNLSSGQQYYSLPPESKALFTLNDAADTVECYFVSHFATPNTLAFAVVPRALAAVDVAHAYQIVLNTPALSFDTLAHELLHVVTNGIHAAPYNDFMQDTARPQSLWFSGQAIVPPLFNRKRIYDEVYYNAFTCPLLKKVP